MEKKIINYTKLGTVKSDRFEYTYEDFFQMMYSAISRNTILNGARYNEEDDCYEITIEGTTYVVHCGKEKVTRKSGREEIIKMLDNLVNITISQKEAEEKAEEITKTKKRVTKAAVENGEKGVFNTNEDKRQYITYLNSQLREKKTGFLSRLFKYKRIGYTEHPGSWGRHFFLGALDIIADIVLVCVFGVGIFTPETLLSGCLFGKAFLDVVGTIINFTFYKSDGYSFDPDSYYYGLSESHGDDIFFNPFSTTTNVVITIITTLVTFLINAFNFIKNIFSETANYQHEKHEMEKKIKSLKKSLSYSKSNGITRKKNNEISGEVKTEEKLNETKESLSPTERSIKDIAKEIEMLKDLILEINNLEWQKEYSRQLLEIIKYYKEASKLSEESGNYLMVHRQVLNQIYSLRFRVEEAIREEKKKQSSDDEFNIMIDEIDKVGRKSNGAK